MPRSAEAPSSTPRLRIGFILAPRFTLCAFANFVDVLRLAADEGDRSRPIHCRWRIISPTGDPIESSCGVRIEPEDRPGDPTRFDYIVVVGGLIGDIEKLHPAHVEFLRQAARLGIPLAGLCTGTFILHRAGLMDGYRACVSWFHRQDFLDQFEGLEPVSDQIFVADRDRLSCSGGASSAQLAAYLVSRHVGQAAALKSLSIMIIDEAMEGERPQPGLPMELQTQDLLVRRALLAMQQHLNAPLSVARIAESLNVSRRGLERHFARQLGITPAEAGKRIRLAHARHLLATTDRSISQVAADTGFCDASHFSRVFRATENATPDRWRTQKERF